MKVNVGFAVYIDVIEFKEFMGKNIDKYKKAFEDWYYEEVIKYGFPVLQQRSDLTYKYFNTDVVIDWMNEVAPECNARIIQHKIEPGKEDTSLPYMCF